MVQAKGWALFRSGSSLEMALRTPINKIIVFEYIMAAHRDNNEQVAGIEDGNWQKKSAEHKKQYQNLLKRADRNKVLKKLPDLHEEAFSKVDCLQCAACCKNYSPRFKTPDIKRISKHLKMKESVFIETYLRLDEEGDYVVKQTPCAFLGADNYCSIYEVRPSDCERFPYTDEDVILKRPNLTLKNATFCPAVYYVMEKLLKADVS
jgi:Fe-S-cluster containining protein